MIEHLSIDNISTSINAYILFNKIDRMMKRIFFDDIFRFYWIFELGTMHKLREQNRQINEKKKQMTETIDSTKFVRRKEEKKEIHTAHMILLKQILRQSKYY